MKNLNNRKNQLIIAAVLLLVIGVANYFNYYAPPKPIQKLLSFTNLSKEEQQSLIQKAKNSKFEKQTINSLEPKDTVEVKKVSEKDINDNYLNYAIDSNGKLVKWNKTKIKVFVSPSEYQRTIYQALSLYNSFFEGYFTFFVTNKRENADIKIDIVDKFDSNENKDSIYMAGVTNNSFSGEDKHLTNSIIQILSKKPNSNQKVTSSEVYKVALHEIGHALGIIGHSPKDSDIMYAATRVSDFSKRDIATLKMMYSNNEELIKEETANFASVKLNEAEEYARKSPNKAISWVNLGRVYYDLNKKDKALDAYKRALSIEPKNPIIYQSMAECYYSSEKYETAIKYYNLSVDYSKTDEEKNPLISMIGMCYAKMENFEQAYTYFKQSYDFDKNDKALLKNYLVSCVETERKQEALNAINDYKLKHPSIVDEEFIKDVLKWAK